MGVALCKSTVGHRSSTMMMSDPWQLACIFALVLLYAAFAPQLACAARNTPEGYRPDGTLCGLAPTQDTTIGADVEMAITSIFSTQQRDLRPPFSHNWSH